MVHILSLLPRSARGPIAQIANDAFWGRNSAYKFWNIVEPLQACVHENTSSMLRTAFALAQRYGSGIDDFTRFLRVAGRMPVDHMLETADLLLELVTLDDGGAELASYIFEALAELSMEEQHLLLEQRRLLEDALSTGSDGLSRTERLQDLGDSRHSAPGSIGQWISTSAVFQRWTMKT